MLLLHDLIENAAETHGANTALILGDERVDYGSLRDQVLTGAAGLVQLGIRPGEQIAVYLDKRIETVVAFFATTSSRAVFVLVNPTLKTRRKPGQSLRIR